jgi:putative ABC transport system ATP-binding protein
VSTPLPDGAPAPLPTAPVSLPLVSARDVTRRFGGGATAVPALRGVSLEADAGELIAICGRSGSGKTTLLNIIGGLDAPTSGSVAIAGRDLTQMPERDRLRMRRSTVAFVFQSFGLIPMLSAADYVSIPLRIAGVRGRLREERYACAQDRRA